MDTSTSTERCPVENLTFHQVSSILRDAVLYIHQSTSNYRHAHAQSSPGTRLYQSISPSSHYFSTLPVSAFSLRAFQASQG